MSFAIEYLGPGRVLISAPTQEILENGKFDLEWNYPNSAFIEFKNNYQIDGKWFCDGKITNL